MAVAMVMISSEWQLPWITNSWDSDYDSGYHRGYSISFVQWPTVGTSYECEVRWLDAGHSRSGDIEDSVTLDFLLSLHFSQLLDFFRSLPNTNGVGTGYYHLLRKLKWRRSFLIRMICQIGTRWYNSVEWLVGVYVCVCWIVVWLFSFLFYSCMDLYCLWGMNLPRGIM